jgi:diguanylate cyclase (GGDEF)-like protein/PAS domain S-box-containing protein
VHQEIDNRFRRAFESAPFGVCICGPDGHIIQANAPFCRMLGYSEQELLNTAWADLTHPDDLGAAQLRKEQLWTGVTDSLDAETRYLHRTGTIVWSRIKVSLVRDSAGTRLYSVVHVEDITERKRIADALKESEDRFRIMADGCPTLLWVTDAEGGSQFVNRAFREFTGVTYEQVEGGKWHLLLHPDDAARYIETLQCAGRGRTAFRAEARVRRADGEWRWLDSHAEPRFSACGQFLGHVGLSPDITERREAEQALRDSQDFAQSTIDALSSHICVLNEAGMIIAVNRAWTDFADGNAPVGHHCSAVGTNYLTICDEAVGPDAAEAIEFASGVRDVLHGKREQYSMEYACHSLSEKRWFIARVRRFTINRLCRILIEHINITERKLAEQVVQRSEEKFRQLAENVSEVFWIIDAASAEIVYVSPAYEIIWGLTIQSLYANPDSWLCSVHPEDRPSAGEVFRRQLQGERLDNEYRIVQPSGAIRWIRDRAFSVRDSDGNVVRLAGVAEDTTERKLSEIQMLQQALYDELTGLPNRRLFGEKLKSAIDECGVEESGAVFFIDLDHFKLVNDTLGHSAGDHLLKDAARRLLGVCGEHGTLARFGGDEFMLVATGFEGLDSVRQFGERLIQCLDEPFKIATGELFIGASIGISIFPENGTDPDLLKGGADIAMHEAKRVGKNQLRFFTPGLADAARERLEMETRLRRALALSEFKLQFQPQFASGRLLPSRFEALVRWYPFDNQPVAPLKFIPMAEQIGLIVPIGTWVLREACRRCAEWQAGNLRGAGVAVNVSPQQFSCPDFVKIVVRTLELTGLPPHLLELELTESVFIQDRKESADTLTKLRTLGVTIALDDFGTGYSSLSYLQNLPLDALKIDSSFLAEAETRQQGAALLRCVVDLAHTLGLRVVGEGVETTAQLDLLHNLGFDEIQGFLLGRPSFDPVGARDPETWREEPAGTSADWGVTQSCDGMPELLS